MMEWIKVSDRLPPFFEDVLVTCLSSLSLELVKDEKYLAIDRFCTWPDHHIPCFKTDTFLGKVTHWIPLPRLPKEEDDVNTHQHEPDANLRQKD